MPVIADPEAVRQIDVVAVASNEGSSRWTAVPGDLLGTWTGDRVRAVLDLVAALPEAEQMRCFNPRYGIRVRADSVVLAEVAFCFQCHNALAFPSDQTPSLPRSFTFDPDSPPAQRLLQLFQTCRTTP